MRIDDLAVKAWYGTKAPLIAAQVCTIAGQEALPTRAAYVTGIVTAPLVTINALAVRAGRTIALSVGAIDYGTYPVANPVPQSPTITFRVNGVSIGTRTYRPEAASGRQSALERWPLYLAHAYTPTVDGVISISAQISGVWKDANLVARS